VTAPIGVASMHAFVSELVMADRDQALRALSHFSRILVRSYDVNDVLFDVCASVTEILRIDGAGITVADRDGRLRFAVSLTATTDACERQQESTQSGPCNEAFTVGAPVLVPDTDVETRWPDFMPVVRTTGIASMAGIPMGLDGTRLGALNLYTLTPRHWDVDDVATAEVFADVATAVLLHASERERSEQVRLHLEHALESRVVIEQAKGVLATRHHISVDAAFERLRSHARRHNASARSVAEAVVNLGLDLSDD
jgi:GAF domain-containing protein